MTIKGYKPNGMFWFYIIAIVMFASLFVYTHALAYIVLEATFVYILAKWPGLFLRKVKA